MGLGVRRWACLVLAAALCGSAAAAEEDGEVSLPDTGGTPAVYVTAPGGSVSYDNATSLTVRAEGRNVKRFALELRLEGQTLTAQAEGANVEYTFTLDTPQTQGATLTVRGYAENRVAPEVPYAEQTVQVLSPKAELIEKMIALAYANSTDSRYKFAPAETDYDIGVCKNFVMRLFDTYSDGYRMLAYPELALHMPKNNSKKACAPYDYGIEWRPETAADGSPFEIVAQFKYDDAKTVEENAELARNLLVQIKKGDFFQIVGYYGGGNGPHSMFIIRDYDPVTQMIHWTDSNMRGTRVNGARWGYLQYDADADVTWWVNVFNMKKRGATLYRLRDDLYQYGETE
ncbi:MAG: hypothetical protein GX418_01465 [Clostridiales bacterium]|nr:hypothetical protein [Clostridiales bacterium]